MPKFQKNTGYQMQQGNAPTKFVNRLFRGIFGGGRQSKKPELPKGLMSGSRYNNATSMFGGNLGIATPMAGGLAMNSFNNRPTLGGRIPGSENIAGGAFLGARPTSLLGAANKTAQSLATKPMVPGAIAGRFASGRKRRRKNIGNSLRSVRGLLS
tara:strand:- start:408 stop:872 length:465 start_codon:yes stop_codon:yes gene_type:complete